MHVVVAAPNTLYGVCPDAAAIDWNSSAAVPCVRYAASNSTRWLPLTRTGALVARDVGIEFVHSFPVSATSIDLSRNAIADIASNLATPVLSLNLSCNRLSTFAMLTTLPALQTLDVSANAIRVLNDDSNVDNFTSLISLSLRRNDLRSLIDNPSFPQKLASLDLSGNAITTFDVSPSTYQLLQRLPTLYMDAIHIQTCTGMLAPLKAHGTVCVVSAGAVSSTPVLETTTGKLSFIFGILTLSMVLYKTVLSRWRILHDEQRDRRALRATCVSSNYSGFEEPPPEYRISLSLDIPTPLVELASLPATQVPYQDLTKCKLVTMSAHALVHDARLRNSVDVGLKVVRTVHGDEASVTSALTSLVHELHILASVSHPHVLGLIGFASSLNLLDFAIVTECAARGPLPALLASTSWPMRLQIALDVAHAITYLHARHIAYNAVATAHVFVTNEWRAKLTGLEHASKGDGHSDVPLFGHFLNELGRGCSDATAVSSVTASCLKESQTDRPSMLQVVVLLQRAQTVA